MTTEQTQARVGGIGGAVAAPFVAWALTLIVPYLLAPLLPAVIAAPFWARGAGGRRAVAGGVIVGSLLTLGYYYFVVRTLGNFE